MNTDARRRASAAFHAKRTALGYRKVTLWLSPAALLRLDELKLAAGSQDKAIEGAILGWRGPESHLMLNLDGFISDYGPLEIKQVKPADTARAKVKVPARAAHISRLKGVWKAP